MITILSDLNPEQKAHAVKEILADLPEWFGLPESTAAYIEEAKELELLAASDQGKTVGFITFKETSCHTAEIHCMGVKKNCHRQGIGSLLINALKHSIRDRYRLLQVKTVAAGHYAAYDQTVAFYHKQGFLDLEIFPEMWDPWNPCLILIMPLSCACPDPIMPGS